MLSTVSFGSTYRMSLSDNAKNIVNYYATQEFCDSQNIPFIENYNENYCTMVSPDSKDNYLETYMANKGIKFVRFNTNKIMSPMMINLRVMKAPKGMYKVKIDADKFEELVKNTGGNYTHCKSNYNEYYKDTLETQMKSVEPISAASLYLVPQISNLPGYIDRYGAESVDKNMLDMVFQMSNITEDSSMYFAMRDAGMEEIPVYMDKESFELAEKMGILAK